MSRRRALGLALLVAGGSLAACATPHDDALRTGRLRDGAHWQVRGADGRVWSIRVAERDVELRVAGTSLWLVGAIADPTAGLPFELVNIAEPRVRFTLPNGREAEWRRDGLRLGNLQFQLAPGRPPPAIDLGAADAAR